MIFQTESKPDRRCHRTKPNDFCRHAARRFHLRALKGNQETVHEEIKSFLDGLLEEKKKQRPKTARLSREAEALQEFVTLEKDHGRIETRSYWQSDQLEWFADKEKWEGLQSVGMVESIRELDGKTTTEIRYFLSSLKLDVKTFARAVRSHWGIENKLHWVMDVCFRED
jgi:predicted transposase YbfD/YdcC